VLVASVVAAFGLTPADLRRPSRGTPREITALDLIEVSLVASPMQPLARVHALD